MYKTVRRHDETQSHADRQRVGRPKLSTVRDDRVLVRLSLQNRRETIPALRASWGEHGVLSSDSTVKRRLQEAGLHGRRAVKKPLLTPVHRAKRLAFAQEHANWTWIDWSTVLWTDESRFTLFQNDGNVFVRRRVNEQLRPDCIVPTVKFGGGGVTVWGAMSYRGTGFLTPLTGNLNARGYIQILEDSMVPSAHLLGYGNHYFFMDDGAPCHRAGIVSTWKDENNVRCLQNWPPQSPDLNPIENLWKELKTSVRRFRSRNLRELAANLETAWANIPVVKCQRLIRSMPDRIQAVIAARGGYTRY